VAGDDDRLALLDLIEKLGEAGFGFGRLDVAHSFDRSD
jgi:hypothetical protein